MLMKKKMLISVDDLKKDLSSSLTKKEIAKKYSLSLYKLNQLLKDRQLARSKNISNIIRQAHRKQTVLKRYGTQSTWQSEKIKLKIRLALINKYGYPNASQIPVIKERKNLTNLKRYGTVIPLLNSKVRQKADATLLQNFGTTNPNQLQSIKQKIRSTNLKRRGVPYVMQDPIVRANSIITKLKREDL